MINRFNVFLGSMLLSLTVAYASGSNASIASINAPGLAKVISGSMDISQAGGHLTVASVKLVGDIAYVTLNSATSASATLALSATGAGHALLTVGQIVEVSTTAAGHVLYTAGKIIAFIPKAGVNKDMREQA